MNRTLKRTRCSTRGAAAATAKVCWAQRVTTAGVATAAMGVVTGCALFTPPPLALGQTEAEVQALLGPPTARYAMPEQVARLEFARGPMGKQTWMVDIGPDGRSRRFVQVLDWPYLADFQARAPGLTVDQLLRELGRPAERRHGGWAGGETWSWRYATHDCLWFQVSVGADGKVIGGGQGIDPICDVNDRVKSD
jgi:hypothetical protein